MKAPKLKKSRIALLIIFAVMLSWIGVYSFAETYYLQIPLLMKVKVQPPIMKRQQVKGALGIRKVFAQELPTPTPEPPKTAINWPFYSSLDEKGQEVANKICEAFKTDCYRALAIAKAESGLRCNAVGHNTNGSIDIGLFQINSIHSARYMVNDPFDCDKNIQIAHDIYTEQGGWQAWSTYGSGSYLSFMP